MLLLYMLLVVIMLAEASMKSPELEPVQLVR